MVVILRKLSPAPESTGGGDSKTSSPTTVSVVTESTDPANTDETVEVKHKNIMPTKEADILSTAQRVSAKWLTNTDLKLRWTTQATFDGIVKSYADKVGRTLSVKGMKKTHNDNLKGTLKNIKAGTVEVRAYIRKKFKSHGEKAQYGRYGIVKIGGAYSLPKDMDQLKLALPLMLAAVKADGFDKEEYGETFWTDATAAFLSALENVESSGTSIATDVAAKALLRKNVEKHLRAIIYLIRSNMPDSWQAELRAWGYDKVRS